MKNAGNHHLLSLTADIVSAHIANNTISQADLFSLMPQIYEALTHVTDHAVPAVEHYEPAVSIKKSVDPNFVICLEDGQKLKMLKRHLLASHNMTPEAYLERWNLPADYPMVAPNYARRRSELAKDIGLGLRKPKLPD